MLLSINTHSSCPLQTRTGLLAQKAALASIISYHVVPGTALTLGGLTSNTTETSQEGDSLYVEVFPTKAFNNNPIVAGKQSSATVLQKDVLAGKAVLHSIDTVLIPSGVRLASLARSG